MNKILQGDCLSTLKTLPDRSVHCCVTSPPYFGLRDYGHDGQIGLEQTPEEYIAKLVEVFREVRRVLRDDATLWLNLGDSYNAAGRTGHGTRQGYKQGTNRASANGSDHTRPSVDSLKPKDLIGIPWMAAFALRADGWYLRQDIIWQKLNPMPESVTDRCTKAHEYVFLFAKSEKYYYDNEAVKESAVKPPQRMQASPETAAARSVGPMARGAEGFNHQYADSNRLWGADGKRNRRSVWSLPTQPVSEAHFATLPEKLIEPCILAGCPPDGIVLDPFMGAGTTALVAVKNGRQYLGCELNPEYIKIAEKRIRKDCGLFLMDFSDPQET